MKGKTTCTFNHPWIQRKAVSERQNSENGNNTIPDGDDPFSSKKLNPVPIVTLDKESTESKDYTLANEALDKYFYLNENTGKRMFNPEGAKEYNNVKDVDLGYLTPFYNSNGTKDRRQIKTNFRNRTKNKHCKYPKE